MGFAMGETLDKALTDLAARPAGRDLDGLERDVWARIEARGLGRNDPAAATHAVGLRWAAVSLALAVGVASGGAAALSRPRDVVEVAIFSVDSSLSPSTLLGDQG